GTGDVDGALGGRAAGARASGAAHSRGAAPGRAGSERPDGTARHHRPPGRAGGAALAGAAGMTGGGVARALDLVTRVRGVRGAMLGSAADGIGVAGHLMVGTKRGVRAARSAA